MDQEWMVIHIPDVGNIKPPEPKSGTKGKKIPTPYIIGGGVVLALLALWYYKSRKNAQSANATAPASVGDTSQGPGVDYSGTGGYDLGYAAGVQAGGGYTSAGGSTGLDPTTLSEILGLLGGQGGGGTGGTGASGSGGGGASTNTGGNNTPPINITVTTTGGGPPTGGAAPGTNTGGGNTGGNTGKGANGGNTGSTPFNAATTPIATQIQDYESGKITFNQLGPNAKKVFDAGYQTLAQYNAAGGKPRATTPTAVSYPH